MKKDIIIIADYTEDASISVEDLCRICGIDMVQVRNFVSYDIIEPLGATQEDWVFDMAQLKRLRTALRLQRDLELNAAGIALVLQLLEEMEALRSQAEMLNRHLLK
jgi:chaperone modulatory protein CbpM